LTPVKRAAPTGEDHAILRPGFEAVMASRKTLPANRTRGAAPLSPDGSGKAARLRAGLPDSETHFTEDELERLVEDVWQHGRVMSEADGSMWRQDACGAWMMREHFGRADSEFGWKIEKTAPEGDGVSGRLRPFHWRNAFDIANGRPHCAITADRSNLPAERQAGPPRNKRP